ncbi:MAG: carboxymuconolactone decarboxylase family protein [Myxococcota bacterium]
MSDSSRFDRGIAMFQEVYGGDVPAPPKGAMDFFDLMIEQTFAELWTREALSVRDRRLVVMGIIAALGEPDTFKIQAKAALKKGELTPEQLREVLMQIAHYAGYPRAAALVGPVEGAIGEAKSD